MNFIIRTSISVLLLVWAYLSVSSTVKGPGQDGFAVFCIVLAVIIFYPILKEINGHFFQEPVKVKKKKTGPRAIY